LHLSQIVNERGELVFSQDWRAMKQMKKDVKKGCHLRMTPSQLQARHKVYHPYNKRIFKERIYQEMRRQKIIAYLEWKREKKFANKYGKDFASNLDEKARFVVDEYI
jgi:hypothetical protein